MSSTESSAQAALQKAKDLQRLAIDSPTTDNRRQFQKHLISLCSYPNHQCKAFFGSLVARHFKEFDDLQDAAINAILDLCEDEDGKTRLIGIGGLKNTARADPRWVKGNAGVLVQLLDSPTRVKLTPAEGEVKQVHNALHTLLSVSPIETIEVFAEECRTSEKDSSDSRRLILEFLSKHSSEVFNDIFCTGTHIKAEDSFYKEFERLIRPSEPFEALTILRLLLPLSIVSGKNARKADAKDFSRAMIEGVSPNAPVGAREEIVELYGEYLAREPPLDPREIMRFYGTHGRTFVKMALEGRGGTVNRQMERMRTVVGDAVKSWEKKEEGPNEAKIIPDFCHALLSRTLETVLRKDFRIDAMLARAVEVFLFAVHQCYFFKDRRKDLKRVELDDLDDLRKLARNAAEKARDKSDEIVFSNIKYMADDLSSPKERLEKVKPSWLQDVRPSAPARPAPAQVQPRTTSVSGGREEKPAIPPAHLLTPPPGGPKTVPKSAKAPLPDSSAADSRPRPLWGLRETPSLPGGEAQQRDTVKQAAATGDVSLASRLSKPLTETSSPSQEAKTHATTVPDAVQKSLASRLSKSTNGSRSDITPSQSRMSANGGPVNQTSQAGVELLGPPSSESSAGKELLGPPSTQQAGVEFSGARSQTGKDATGIQKRTLQAGRESTSNGPGGSTSLLDRLSPAPFGVNGKRNRVEGESGDPAARPSLLSRMALKDDLPMLKKARSSQSATQSTEGGRSLLNRMSREAAPPVTPPITAPQSSKPAQAPGTSLSIRNSAVQRAEPGAALSIFGRAGGGSLETPTPKPDSTDFFSIKHRASSSTPATPAAEEKPQGLSIRSASGSMKRPSEDEEGVVRKGRGFQRDEEGDDIMMDFTPVQAVTPTNGSGGWTGPPLAARAKGGLKKGDGRRRF